MAYNVFISYSTKNLHIVQWAVNTLMQRDNIAVFAAEYSVQPSQVLNAEIERAIRSCDLFILLWSHDAAHRITYRRKSESPRHEPYRSEVSDAVVRGCSALNKVDWLTNAEDNGTSRFGAVSTNVIVVD